jgi:predicted MFS family arabinose efflux permease
MLTGVVTGLYQLIAVRFLFGMGEAGAYPNMGGVVSQSLPDQRAMAQGFIWGASRAGGALAPLLVVPMQAAFGWRTSFFVFGAAGIVWCALWLWLYREPSGPRIASHSHNTPWGLLFRSPRVWTIMLMYFCYAWGSWFYFSWLATWLIKGRGFTEAEMGIFAALPFVMGSLGSFAGGFVSDASVRRFGPRYGRAIVGSTCLSVGAALLVATALTTDRGAAVALLSIGFGILDLMLPSAWALCLDISGSHAGAVSGAMNMAGQFGGFLCTILFGYLVGQYNDYNLPLFVIAGMVAFSAFLFTRIDATKPLFPEGSAARSTA